MNCTESLALLSDYHDALLSVEDSTQVRIHLLECAPCDGVFRELKMIVIIAADLRDGRSTSFPDEAAFWERLTIHKQQVL